MSYPRKQLEKLKSYLSEDIRSPEEAKELIRTHLYDMMRLCGVGGVDQVKVYVHTSPEAAEKFSRDHPTTLYPSDVAEYKDQGQWSPGLVICNTNYDTHIFNFFAWEFEGRSRNVLFSVMLHEVAHVMTSIWTIARSEDDNLTTFVNERIILPFLNAVTYDPINRVLIGRKMVNEQGVVIENPLIPPRGDG